jgi:polyphenol oxidase
VSQRAQKCPMLLTADSLSVPHGFCTRRGGVSAGAYASLNCSFSSGDDRDAVIENRARAVRAVGNGQLVGLMQVHGADVVEVTEPWQPGAGPEADAMVTDRPGIALGIVTADCAPVLLADTSAGVVGAAHAGWRGAVAGVIEATVAAMQRVGARRERITAAIGPCIQQNSYEVASDLRDALLHQSAANATFFAPGEREARWQFDLPGYCASRLSNAGVHNVATVNADTASDEARFFSHRRRTLRGGGPIGHQISIIVLERG